MKFNFSDKKRAVNGKISKMNLFVKRERNKVIEEISSINQQSSVHTEINKTEIFPNFTHSKTFINNKGISQRTDKKFNLKNENNKRFIKLQRLNKKLFFNSLPKNYLLSLDDRYKKESYEKRFYSVKQRKEKTDPFIYDMIKQKLIEKIIFCDKKIEKFYNYYPEQKKTLENKINEENIKKSFASLFLKKLSIAKKQKADSPKISIKKNNPNQISRYKLKNKISIEYNNNHDNIIKDKKDSSWSNQQINSNGNLLSSNSNLYIKKEKNDNNKKLLFFLTKKAENKRKKVYSDNFLKKSISKKKGNSYNSLEKIIGNEISLEKYNEFVRIWKGKGNYFCFRDIENNLKNHGILFYCKNNNNFQEKSSITLGFLYYSFKLKFKKIVLSIDQLNMMSFIEKENILNFINLAIDFLREKIIYFNSNLKNFNFNEVVLRTTRNEKIKLRDILLKNKWSLYCVYSLDFKMCYNFKKKFESKFEYNQKNVFFSINLIFSNKYFNYFNYFFLDKQNNDVDIDLLIQNMKLICFPDSLDIYKMKFSKKTLKNMEFPKNSTEKELKEFYSRNNFFKKIINSDKINKLLSTKLINFNFKNQIEVIEKRKFLNENSFIRYNRIKFLKKYYSISLNCDIYVCCLKETKYNLIIVEKVITPNWIDLLKFLRNIYLNSVNENETLSNNLWIPNFKKKIVDHKWFGDKQSIYKINIDFDVLFTENNIQFEVNPEDVFLKEKFIFGFVEIDFFKKLILPIFFCIISPSEFK